MNIEYKKYLRCIVFLICALVVAIYFKHQVAIAFFCLAAFFYAIDVHKAGKRKEESCYSNSGPIGVLGTYIVDDTESFGMFIELAGKTVFISLREDNLLEQRKKQANYLFNNVPQLEESLREYFLSNPKFVNRKISYIGLHDKHVELGAIFWEPEGHTTLNGTNFT